MSRPRFRIKFMVNHPKGFVLIPRNIAAAKETTVFNHGLYAEGASSHYIPSNKFYQTQFEYHGCVK